jgi:arylsulfatase A-like enzyme
MVNRRDILKLLGGVSAGLALNRLASQSEKNVQPNIFIIVLDALTTHSMSLYGHIRTTTSNLDKFAQSATVYHNHYSAATFTTPGTASLLTGMYPWTHRAVNYRGLVKRAYADRNIFHLIGDQYKRIAFTQNMFAEMLLTQFSKDIDQHISLGAYSKLNNYAGSIFDNDLMGQYLSFDGFLYGNRPGSLLFGAINRFDNENELDQLKAAGEGKLESALPGLHFEIENVMDGIASQITNTTNPTLAYYHFFPPHDPYIPGPQFESIFNDGWKQPTKPRHPLAANSKNNKELNESRLKYEQYIARTDAALGSFLHKLNENGLRENSYIIITSDHGELFERGIEGHSSPLIYEGGIHVPLLISTPGQTTQYNIKTITNSVDLLPTLLAISGNAIPEWCEGTILPNFDNKNINNETRVTFSIDAKKSGPNFDLGTVSIAMRQGKYKLIFYKGYNQYKNYPKDPIYFEGTFELYNIESDPLELDNLINKEAAIANRMKEILLKSYDAKRRNL